MINVKRISHATFETPDLDRQIGLTRVKEQIAAQRMLLVFDSCERVVDAAAILTEDIFNRAPGVHILATSREPLRAGGERVQRLTPLGVPPVSGRLRACRR